MGFEVWVLTVDACLADAQSQGASDSQVDVGGRVRRCQCWSGGPGNRGRLAAAPQLQPHYPENNVHDTVCVKTGSFTCSEEETKGKMTLTSSLGRAI